MRHAQDQLNIKDKIQNAMISQTIFKTKSTAKCVVKIEDFYCCSKYPSLMCLVCKVINIKLIKSTCLR